MQLFLLLHSPKPLSYIRILNSILKLAHSLIEMHLQWIMADEFIILGLDICFEDYYASEYMKDHIFELWKKIDRVIHPTCGVVKSKPVCV